MRLVDLRVRRNRFARAPQPLGLHPLAQRFDRYDDAMLLAQFLAR